MSTRRDVPSAGSSFNLPNAISAVRFPLAALFPLLDGPGRIAVVAAAAGSDWIDGRVARRRGHITRLGEVLDPVADKTFMLVALVTLGVEGALPLWALPLLLVRDIGVAIGTLMFAARGTRVRMPARRAGKLVTWLQFGAIGLILIWPSAAIWAAAATGVTGLYALHDYAGSISLARLHPR
ncbi:MAG: CDP-alcohol phosphatidyltransferase family protein [Gemmatimonadetes bacterium]|nr:CDP-alcohol phosphatidyltransferase family protein [Gemmatimonadota bacterium]